MTEIESPFYFRLETGGAGLEGMIWCVLYQKREDKRWWQREYRRIDNRLFFYGEDGEAEDFAAALLADTLAEWERRRKTTENFDRYNDFTPVPLPSDK